MPIIKENPKYHGQDKLPVTIWMIAQACQGDLVVGVYMWVHYLFPMLSSKSSCNPQSRDLILYEVVVDLSREASTVIIGCLTQNPDYYKHSNEKALAT
ncbi:hypothetical protein RHSIM_Rhsim03G0110000 [Rhododendron simsii]|uniref:Uncharacterized protein n=1 Tax=Rhododendron simsii TaxID=118357 RepID=A0A834H9L7_RHOSS|nr:hypothetical protein RHSIM_Rhsim03G0110000 [Rhododendron simsii]